MLILGILVGLMVLSFVFKWNLPSIKFWVPEEDREPRRINRKGWKGT